MNIRKRRSDRSGRPPLLSPGRPSVAGRDERRRFWAAIAAGLTSEEAGISRLQSERRSRSFACKATRCRRSLADSGGRHRRSPGSCGATPPPEAAVWNIVRRQRNGMPSEPLAVPSRRSLRKTGHCGRMWKNDWLASSSLRTVLLFPVRPCAGKAVGMDPGRIGGGQTHGARSRSPVACRSTSRKMRPCTSAMKPSIKRCSFTLEVRCAASWRPVCAPGGHCGCRGRACTSEARPSSRPRS